MSRTQKPNRQHVTAVACIVAILAATLALGGNRPLNWMLFSAVICILFFVQIAVHDRQMEGRGTRRLAVPIMLYSAVLLWGVVQVTPGLVPTLAHPTWDHVAVPGTVSADPGQGWHYVLRMSVYAMVAWIAVRASRSAADAETYFTCIALGSTGLAAFGLVAQAADWNPILGSSASEVISASFINRNAFATFALIGLVVNLALYQRIMGNLPRRIGARQFIEAFFDRGWIPIMGVIIVTGALLMSQSRAGLVSTAIALLTLWLASKNDHKERGMIAFASAAIFIVAVGLMASQGVLGRLLATDVENARFIIYPRIVEGILDRPFLGHGLGAFQDVFRAYVPPEASVGEWDMAHSSYLENAFELGLISAAALYLSLLLVAVSLWSGLRKRRRNREFGAAAIACFVGCAVHAAVDFTLQMPANAALLAFVVGLGLAQTVPTQDRSKRKPLNA